MLKHIDIRDLVVVESLSLSFRSGLTVLTGETGAGKSILLTAFGLALGDRADSGMVRSGAQRAEINLGFDLCDCPDVLNWLRERDLADDDECWVRRLVTADGRSRAYINGSPVNLQSLQELGQGLVEIHGQHAHVQLTKSQEQRRLLDASAGCRDLAARVDSLYRQWRKLNDELERITRHASDRAARQELLEFQVEELEQFDLTALNYAELVEEHTRQANVGRILEVGQAELDSLYDHEAHSVSARLARSIHALAELCRLAPEFSDSLSLLQEAQVQVKEAALQLRRDLERQESDPAHLDWLEQRLADVHRLARKHQTRPETLSEHYATLKAELESLRSGAESTEKLRLDIAEIRESFDLAASELSRRREAGARQMEQRIAGIIRQLGMPQAAFVVAVQTDEAAGPTPVGADSVEFLVSANPGMPPRSLARVASGGELSRISLAIQVAALEGKTVPTLVFDEVDTGIGGGIAEVVGQKLRLLGEDRQVFCVTHLPQVAVQGHEHLLVEKRTLDEGTQSSVHALEGDLRTAEIARMLGGVKITDQTLAHAREMLSLVLDSTAGSGPVSSE